MASKGQSVTVSYVAWDVVANSGKTDDSANHTLRWIKDGTSSAPTNTPTQVDSTNAPGIYKLVLTSAESTCDVGTLAGKSSTSNVVIIPITISFEKLPTYDFGTNGAIATLNGFLTVDADVKYINSGSLVGNNATLRLKALDIQNSTGTAITAQSTGSNGHGVFITGHGVGNGIFVSGGTSTAGPGGTGVKIQGGDGSNLNSGGIGLSVTGGSISVGGSGNGGHAVQFTAGGGTSWGTGLYIYSANATGCIMLAPNGSGIITQGRIGSSIIGTDNALLVYSPEGTAAEVVTDTGDYSLALYGPTLGLGITRPRKNVALSNFMFPMFDSTTKNPLAGLVVTAERAIDGNAFAPCSSGVAEISNGTYRINLSSDDMNGEKIMFRFSATGADVNFIELITQD